jgi:glycosyltransferase involved in cell wall biosynthesis
MQKLPIYVLVTPARNEAEFIESTIQSVVAQTAPPAKWVIVSDGSTDGTDEIVRRYAAEHPWIELVRTPERKERHFSGKVYAFNAGYARLDGVDYDVIGSLDADITFDPEYFAFLLGKLVENPALGLVGTPFQEEGKPHYDYRFVSIEHVSGACQVFRRQCFEAIGGYQPMKGGGIDYIAVLTSRMKGWKTRTFTEKVCWHHRPMGTAQHDELMARFKLGVKDYVLGSHPLWALARAAYQSTQKPVLAGGMMLLAGYVWTWAKRTPRPIPAETIAFRRREEMQRLRAFLGGSRRGGRPSLQAPPESA